MGFNLGFKGLTNSESERYTDDLSENINIYSVQVTFAAMHEHHEHHDKLPDSANLGTILNGRITLTLQST